MSSKCKFRSGEHACGWCDTCSAMFQVGTHFHESSFNEQESQIRKEMADEEDLATRVNELTLAMES